MVCLRWGHHRWPRYTGVVDERFLSCTYPRASWLPTEWALGFCSVDTEQLISDHPRSRLITLPRLSFCRQHRPPGSYPAATAGTLTGRA